MYVAKLPFVLLDHLRSSSNIAVFVCSDRTVRTARSHCIESYENDWEDPEQQTPSKVSRYIVTRVTDTLVKVHVS